MIFSHQKGVRRLAVLALFAILAVAAYGFAAQNTVDNSYAGDGVGDILGFNVGNIDYELDANNPNLLERVEFDLTPIPFDGGAHVWFYDADNGAGNMLGQADCSLDNAGHATCTGLAVGVLAAESIRVVAVD